MKRLDLTDPEAEHFCLSCNLGYRRREEPCGGCGAERLVPGREVLDALRTSVPGGTSIEAVPLARLSEPANPEGLRAVRDALVARRSPFIQLAEDARLLKPDADGAVELLAPAETLQAVVDSLAEKERSVRLVQVPSSYEAELLEGRLRDAGIPFEVQAFTSQLALTSGRLAAVEIRVTGSDLERAREAISASWEEPPSVDEQDRREIRELRLSRRFLIARMLLYLFGATHLFTAVFAFAVHWLDALATIAVGILLIALASWSRKQPHPAFLWSFLVLVAGTVLVMVTGRPFMTLPGLLCLIAVYFAYEAARDSEAGPAKAEPTSGSA